MSAVNSLPLEHIAESPFNPRKTFDKDELAKLAESIKTYGVLQPILVRPVNGSGSYECVFGHRRLRAAKLAGLEAIPVAVRELDDNQVLEAQLVENLQRADVHPLEEGAAYHQLHEKCGFSVDEIAAKVGKSIGTIHARMKLCSLDGKARQALIDGELSASVAVLIARIPDEKLRTEAANQILNTWDGPLSFKRASEIVSSRYMLRLAEAPFDTKDHVMPGGACSACPKRTGANPELFADVKGKDVCTDPGCYHTKVKCHSDKLKVEAEARGQEVLGPKESATALGYGGGWVKLDEKCYDDPKTRTYRKLLGKSAPAPVLAISKDGQATEVLRAKDASKALEAAGHEFAKKAKSRFAAASGNDGYAKRQRETQALKRAAVGAAIDAIVHAAEDGETDDTAFWKMLAREMIGVSWHDVASDVAKRRGIECGKGRRPEDSLKKTIDGLDEAQLRGLVVELLITKGAYFACSSGITDGLKAALELYGLEYKPFEAKAKADFKAAAVAKKTKSKAKAKAKAKAKTPAPKKKTEATPGICAKCGCTEDDPCADGCAWANSEETLCTACVP